MSKKVLLGTRLRTARQQRGWSQVELAKLLNIYQQKYQKYEAGLVEPGIELIEKMAQVLDVDIDWLFGADSYDGQTAIIATPVVPWEHITTTGPSQKDNPAYSKIGVDFARPESFGVRIKDDSMEPEFRVGDVAVVNPHESLESGSFVLVSINGTAMIRKYLTHPEVGFSCFMPLRDTYPEQVYTSSSHIRILGKVIGKYKRY